MKQKRKSLVLAEKRMEELLARVGYKGKNGAQSIHEIPDYRVKSNLPNTSDKIPGKTPKRYENRYSGHEIAGIVVSHKSNLMPIRKDNMQAAVDAAQMRRN